MKSLDCSLSYAQFTHPVMVFNTEAESIFLLLSTFISCVLSGDAEQRKVPECVNRSVSAMVKQNSQGQS